MSTLPRDDDALVTALGGASDPLSDDALTADFRVLQRERGHRYSLDDVITARRALAALESSMGTETPARPIRHADIGCGLGSVLLMVAWKLRTLPATHLGIEAQAISFELATRNVARNGMTDRITLVRGDLRELARDAARAGAFDLVTGTPPYVPPGRSTPAPDPQKAYARIEYRGGVEDYLAAMARLLAPGGHAVVCCDARMPERALEGGRAVGLAARERLDVVPRLGQPALLCVFTFGHAGEPAPYVAREPFVARDSEGARTPDYLDLRAFFGLPGTTRAPAGTEAGLRPAARGSTQAGNS